MIIRNMESADFEAVYKIELESYKTPWSRENFLAEFNNKYAYMYVLLHNDTIIGYGGFWLVLDMATITKVTIHPSLRRKGLGNILLADILSRIESYGAIQTTLEVRISNTTAINLYTKFGFEIKGIRKYYYADGEDAYMMSRLKEGSEEEYAQTYIGD